MNNLSDEQRALFKRCERYEFIMFYVTRYKTLRIHQKVDCMDIAIEYCKQKAKKQVEENENDIFEPTEKAIVSYKKCKKYEPSAKENGPPKKKRRQSSYINCSSGLQATQRKRINKSDQQTSRTKLVKKDKSKEKKKLLQLIEKTFKK